MDHREKTRSLLLTHFQAYPRLQMQDVFKFLHQSTFGCEHLVASPASAAAYVAAEYERTDHDVPPLVEPLDGEYCRVHLSNLNTGLCADTFALLFSLSAKTEADGAAQLAQKLAAAKELIREGLLPFPVDEFDRAVEAWAKDGYPALHHSDAFRAAYAPAYRVLAREYVPFLPLFAALDQRLAAGPTVLAIEGGSASGKTTLSRLLETVYPCTVFHADDFFLRPEQRTPERYAEIGGNLDRERLLAEVLRPLRAGGPVRYRKFDCSTMGLGEITEVIPQVLTVVEGAYSMHPDLAGYYDLSVFLDIAPQLQRERIGKRNSPQMAKRFFEEWIPLEQRYFSALDVPARCHLRISIPQE